MEAGVWVAAAAVAAATMADWWLSEPTFPESSPKLIGSMKRSKLELSVWSGV